MGGDVAEMTKPADPEAAPKAKGDSATLRVKQEIATPAPKAKIVEPAPEIAEEMPEMLAEARGTPDDLKKIKGVGPKLEGVLNELGVWHFWQIARWTEAEIAWVDTRLKFKGRIERDEWIAQAKILAEGGETEFSKRS